MGVDIDIYPYDPRLDDEGDLSKFESMRLPPMSDATSNYVVRTWRLQGAGLPVHRRIRTTTLATIATRLTNRAARGGADAPVLRALAKHARKGRRRFRARSYVWIGLV